MDKGKMLELSLIQQSGAALRSQMASASHGTFGELGHGILPLCDIVHDDWQAMLDSQSDDALVYVDLIPEVRRGLIGCEADLESVSIPQ